MYLLTEECREGHFRFITSLTHRRVRICNDDRFETITIDPVEQTAKGDAAFVAIDPNSESMIAWSLPSWGMEIHVSWIPDGNNVTCYYDEGRLYNMVVKHDLEIG